MSSKDGILFSDIFDIEDIDKDGKHFDRVSRLFAKCDSNDAKVTLDYNVELYPLEIGDRFTLTLASTLSLTGESGAGGQGVKKESWRPNQTEKTLADEYEYVMHGKVYRYDDAHETNVSVYISFGGLLMQVEAEYRLLQNIVVGEHVFLLMRK